MKHSNDGDVREDPPHASKKSRKKKQKDFRKKIIDTSIIPEMTTLPGSINPQGFAKAREAEIKILQQEIEDGKFRSVRRVFQTLPRSMRRRAASYNMKRLPRRLLEKAMAEAAKDPETNPKAIKKPGCRRRRRRRKLIDETFGNKTGKLWLSTHIWHSKRARMENIWGYRIATRCNEKVLKSCLRASKHGTFLYDSSYHEIIGMSKEFFSLNSDKICSLDFLECIDGKSGPFDDFVYDFSKNKNDPVVLGPAQFIFDEEKVSIICHPLITPSIQSILKSCEILKREFSIFELEGAYTKDIIENLLGGRPENFKVYSDQVAAFMVGDPRFTSIPSSTIKINAFWNSKTQPIAKAIIDKEKIEQNLLPGKALTASSDTPKMPLLISSVGNEMADGRKKHTWRLIVPSGEWSRILWVHLIFQHPVRFGGLKERKFIDFENEVPHFPDDFLFTPAGGIHALQVNESLLAEWERKPASKRINYKKSKVPSPFTLSDPPFAPNQLYHVYAVGGGVPKYNGNVIDSDERVIGQITSGGYSQKSGKGKGFAYCALTQSNHCDKERRKVKGNHNIYNVHNCNNQVLAVTLKACKLAIHKQARIDVD